MVRHLTTPAVRQPTKCSERVVQLHHGRALLVCLSLSVVPVLAATSADTVFAPFSVRVVSEVAVPLLLHACDLLLLAP
eukprot:3853106-Amphidinium_carterae.1